MEDVEFTIKVKMNPRWVDSFMSMLKYMELCGDCGKSRRVALFSDGDGDFRPKFKTDINFQMVKPYEDDDGDRIYDAG